MPPADRRPIAARDMPVFQAMAGWLVRRGASPNGISLAGMGAGLLAGLAFAATPYTADAPALFVLGAVFVQLRLLANMLDGMVAVGRGIASPVGELYNEVPDRVSDTAVLAGLGWAAFQPGLGWAAAAVAMGTAYIRCAARAAGAPSDFRGPMAKPHRMNLVTIAALICAFGPAPWAYRVITVTLWLVVVLGLVTCWRRLAGAAHALRAGAPGR